MLASSSVGPLDVRVSPLCPAPYSPQPRGFLSSVLDDTKEFFMTCQKFIPKKVHTDHKDSLALSSKNDPHFFLIHILF